MIQHNVKLRRNLKICALKFIDGVSVSDIARMRSMPDKSAISRICRNVRSLLIEVGSLNDLAIQLAKVVDR